MPAVLTPRPVTEDSRNVEIHPLLIKRFDIDWRYISGDDFWCPVPVESNICLHSIQITVWEPWMTANLQNIIPPGLEIVLDGVAVGLAPSQINNSTVVELNITQPWMGGSAQLHITYASGMNQGRLSVHFFYTRMS